MSTVLRTWKKNQNALKYTLYGGSCMYEKMPPAT